MHPALLITTTVYFLTSGKQQKKVAGILKRYENIDKDIISQNVRKKSEKREWHSRVNKIYIQDKRRRSKLPQKKFKKEWDSEKKKQNKIGKIQMPPRENNPTNINELNAEQLASLPGTVRSNYFPSNRFHLHGMSPLQPLSVVNHALLTARTYPRQ